VPAAASPIFLLPPRFVKSWDDLEAPQNVRIASIPTVFDKSLAPPGKAVGACHKAGASAACCAWAGEAG
jgi:phytoene dehydrogenase-like protein